MSVEAGKEIKSGTKGEATRHKIVLSAIRVIAKYGMESATAERFAKDAKVTKPLIFHYFGDTEQLKMEAIKACIEGGKDFVGRELAASKMEPLESYVRANLKWIQIYPDQSSALIAAIQRSSYHRPTRKILDMMYTGSWGRLSERLGSLEKARSLHSIVVGYWMLANMKLETAPLEQCIEECVMTARSALRTIDAAQ